MKSFINFLPPWVETNIQPAFYDKESGTVLQQTARMYAKVNQLVRCFNELSKEVQDYVKQVIDLRTYVEDYFENLDVQEEINNKLDEMAEDGTLADIVGDYLGDTVKYIFPKNWYGAGGSGDASIIKANGKNILIDCSTTSNKADLYTFLYDNDSQHLDYFILSHYDIDHYGNIFNLINDGYLDSTSVVYLPASPTSLGFSDKSEIETQIKSALTTANISYIEPDEGDTLTINNLVVTFLNCNVSELIAKDYDDYNNCSMMCYFKHYDNKVLYTGDCGGDPLKRLYDEQLVTGTLSLYKVNHHGILSIGEGSMSIRLMESTIPEYAFVPLNVKNFENNNASASSLFSWLKNNGVKIYGQFVSHENCIFESGKFNFRNTQGTPLYSLSNSRVKQTLHVDSASTSNFPDGSQEKPYKDLPQAFGMAEQFNGVTEIYLADGEYGIQHPDENSWANISRSDNCTIKIFGNTNDRSKVVIKGGCIFRQSNVEFYYCTFVCDYSNASIVSNFSNLRFGNCLFKSTETSDTITAVKSTLSKIYFNYARFENVKYAIESHSDTLTLDTVNMDNVYIPIVTTNGSTINLTGKNNYTNLRRTTPAPLIIDQGNVEQTFVNCNLRELYSGSTVDSGTITIDQDIRLYNVIHIVSSYSGTFSEATIRSFKGTGFTLEVNYAFATPNGKGTIVFHNDGTATVNSPEIIRSVYAKIDETGRLH